ncbi:MAG: glycosyltransferase family 39 protein [Deltaproteobacteria bacterium]|nr:glycosyltransferase family 39 protein [Deltaproteobacteria bacterium]
MAKEIRYLSLILGASLIVRCVYVLAYLDNTKMYWSDTVHYYAAATNLVEHGTFGRDPEQPDKPFGLEPVYPVFVAAVMWPFGKSLLAIRLSQCLVFTLSAVVIFRILTRLTSRVFALLGTAFYSFYPFYIYTSGCVLTEAIYPPVLVLYAFLCLEYLHTGRARYHILAALVLGVAFHTRVSSITLIVPLLALPFFRNGKLDLEFLKKGGVGIVVVLLLSVPWGLRNYRVYGRITIPRTFTGPGTQDVSVATLLRQYTNRETGAGSLGIARSSFRNVCTLLSPVISAEEAANPSSTKEQLSSRRVFQIISVFSAFPLLISGVCLPMYRRDGPMIFLYSLLVFYLLPYVFLTARIRFRLPIDFVMIIFLTVWLTHLYESTLRWRKFGQVAMR